MLEALSHSTAVWVAVSFIIFALLAFKLGRASVTGALDGRIREIKSEIENAERLRVEAQELLAQYQRKQRDAQKESEDIIKRAEDQAGITRRAIEEKLTEMMERREAQLAERLQRIEENAIAEIQSHAADLAMAATTEMIIQTLDEKTNTALNEESIKSLSKHLN